MPSRKSTIKATNAARRGQRKTNLKDPIYHDDDAARAHLESLLWSDGPVCPHCGVVGNATAMKGATTRPGLYKCKTKECRKPFTVTVKTVMERSHIPLHKWVLAAHFMSSSKKGMSALQLQRMLGTNYETAWFLFHRLREAANGFGHSAGGLGGEGKVVEADETYVGGKEENKHARKRLPRHLSAEAKQAVVTLVERGGDAHSNTAESYFAVFKRGVYGTFHNLSEAHLHRYLAKFDFRWSTRSALGVDDVTRAEHLLKGTAGKRLVYRQPAEAAHA